MKIVVFAGGTGRRLWPISRQKSPKQFEPIIDSKSTVQLTMDRLKNLVGIENIFISTNERYVDILVEQLPDVPVDHFIGEPERRDLAAAVGLAMLHIHNEFGPNEAVAIVWGDNYMTDEAAFVRLLNSGESIIKEGKAKIVYIGETPRFANNNLGWIGIGEERGEAEGLAYHDYVSWIYRPPLLECEQMFASGNFVWNTGYFVTTSGFILEAYQEFQPTIWNGLQEISQTLNDSSYTSTLQRVYPNFESVSFDDAIVRNIDTKLAVVLHGKTGWSDPGTLYALKESVDSDPEVNVKKGLVVELSTRDSLLYNYEDGKLLAVAGLDGMVVVNTEDAILVVHKDDINLVKEIVNGLIETELEKYS